MCVCAHASVVSVVRSLFLICPAISYIANVNFPNFPRITSSFLYLDVYGVIKVLQLNMFLILKFFIDFYFHTHVTVEQKQQHS